MIYFCCCYFWGIERQFNVCHVVVRIYRICHQVSLLVQSYTLFRKVLQK